jgi:hypothetical protein
VSCAAGGWGREEGCQVSLPRDAVGADVDIPLRNHTPPLMGSSPLLCSQPPTQPKTTRDRYRAPRLPGEADAPDGGEQLKTEQEQQQQQQQQQAPAAQPKSEPAAEPRPGLPPPTSIKSEAPTGQPSARAASSAAASMPAPGAGYAASAAAATAARGALPSMSQGSVQPSGSVLTASRPPKVRIRMPRASGGSGSGGGAGPDSGEPAAKRAKQ